MRFLPISDYSHKQDVGGHETHPTQELVHNRDNQADLTILEPGQALPGTGFKALDFRDLAKTARLEKSFDNYSGSHPTFPNITLTTEDITRCKMAWRAIEAHPQDSEDCRYDPFPTARSRHWSNFMPPTLVQRCRNWPDIDDVRQLPMALGITLAALIYGGLHALAWFAHFNSSDEQLLWRISACVVMGGLPSLHVLASIFETAEDSETIPDSINVLSIISMGLLLMAYMSARLFLVVECFVNLSHLPAGVYDVPKWTSYFPHIS